MLPNCLYWIAVTCSPHGEQSGMYLVSFLWSLPLFWPRRTALPAHGQPGRGLKTAAFLMFSLLFANIVKDILQSSYHDAAINKLTLLILSCIQRLPWFLSCQDIIQVSTTFIKCEYMYADQPQGNYELMRIKDI